MNNGWIKLHRKILLNTELSNDIAAFNMFVRLLLIVDKNSGEYNIGRFQLAELTGSKPTTAYKVLKRLEKWSMIECSSNNKVTRIRICNWGSYQQDSNNKVTTKGQQSNNKVTLNKNRELRIKKYSNVEIQSIYDLYISKFKKNSNQYKLTNFRKLKIQARLKDAGSAMLKQAIENVSDSAFHMGDNDRGWTADLDYIVRTYEQVEKLSNLNNKSEVKQYDW